MLGGITYPTNTSIMIQELGESDKDSLKCTTTLETCCQNSSQANFYYPNGSEVLSLRGGSIYRTRGNGFVSLKKGTVGEPAPLGRYRCEIPDGKGIVQNLYITLGEPKIRCTILLCINIVFAVSLFVMATKFY